MVTQPDWIEQPSGSDLADAYPKVAEARSIEGEATISCKVDASGSLRACIAVSESPKGYGFGAAALAMASRFRMSPMLINGQAVDDGKIIIPISFRLSPQSADSNPWIDHPLSAAFSTLLVLGFGIYFGARIILKPVLAFRTSPEADVTRIRANLGGIYGEAGPSREVLDIVHDGGTLPTRSTDAERIYRVTLHRPDGATEQRTVRIEVAFLGEGRMHLDPLR